MKYLILGTVVLFAGLGYISYGINKEKACQDMVRQCIIITEVSDNLKLVNKCMDRVDELCSGEK